MFKPYVSVLDFSLQHGLRQHGYNGILVMKSERHWMIMFPDGQTFWNGQPLANRLIPRIEDGRLLMPKEELEQGFRVAGTQTPELDRQLGGPTGADLFVVGSQEFPLHPKRRDDYNAYPVNRLYDGDVFHRLGELIVLKTPPLDLRPKVVLRHSQLELATMAGQMTFQKAEMLVFRNRAWAMLGVLSAVDQRGKAFTADYLAMLRVKGHQFQLKLSVTPR